MDLGLCLGTFRDEDREASSSREPSRGGGDNAYVVDEDRPSLQLELKLPCSESENGLVDRRIDLYGEDCGFEMGNSPAAPPTIKAERMGYDDDDAAGRAARKKLRLTKEQFYFLEQSFKEHTNLHPKERLSIAEKLNLQPRQVEVWFQNRRARTKLKQMETEYERLKQRCGSLTVENQNLHRELEQLKSLVPHPPQPAASTPALCPSCERIAALEAGRSKKLGGLRIHLKHGDGFHKVAYQVG